MSSGEGDMLGDRAKMAHPRLLYQRQTGKFMTGKPGQGTAAYRIHCLHGTFQSPAVWPDLVGRVQRAIGSGSGGLSGIRLEPVYERIEPQGVASPAEWASRWLGSLAEPATGPATEPVTGRRPLLMGYSLGGRLALHALLDDPDRWAAVVLVSSHPGDRSDDERRRTAARDATWAARCRRDPWGRVLADWDALPVFGGRPNLAPRALDGSARDRTAWAETFERLGRGRQADLRGRFAAIAAAGRLPPLLYVSGGEDVSYCQIGAELACLAPLRLEHVTIPGACHRVPWEQPDLFAQAVAEWLSRAV